MRCVLMSPVMCTFHPQAKRRVTAWGLRCHRVPYSARHPVSGCDGGDAAWPRTDHRGGAPGVCKHGLLPAGQQSARSQHALLVKARQGGQCSAVQCRAVRCMRHPNSAHAAHATTISVFPTGKICCVALFLPTVTPVLMESAWMDVPTPRHTRMEAATVVHLFIC